MKGYQAKVLVFDEVETPQERFSDPTMAGHNRPNVGAKLERCSNKLCGWTSDYPAAEGAKQEAGNSFYNYHHKMGLR